MKLAGIILLLLLCCEASAAVIDCQPKHPGDSRPSNWAWRTIDGKQCWYKGPQMMSKDRLRWPPVARPDVAEQADEAEQPRGIKPFAPAAAPVIEETREEVMPNDRSGYRPGPDNATPTSSTMELMAWALLAPVYEIVPLPQPRPHPSEPPLWLVALLVVALPVGAGLAYKFMKERL